MVVLVLVAYEGAMKTNVLTVNPPKSTARSEDGNRCKKPVFHVSNVVED